MAIMMMMLIVHDTCIMVVASVTVIARPLCQIYILNFDKLIYNSNGCVRKFKVNIGKVNLIQAGYNLLIYH